VAYVLNFHPISCLTESEFRSAGIKEGGRKREGGGVVQKQRTKENPRHKERQTTQDAGFGFEPRPQSWEANVVPIVSSLLSIFCLILIVCLFVWSFTCMFVCSFVCFFKVKASTCCRIKC